MKCGTCIDFWLSAARRLLKPRFSTVALSEMCLVICQPKPKLWELNVCSIFASRRSQSVFIHFLFFCLHRCCCRSRWIVHVKFTTWCASAGSAMTPAGPTSAKSTFSCNERTWATSRSGVTEISAPCTCRRDDEVHGMLKTQSTEGQPKLFIYR